MDETKKEQKSEDAVIEISKHISIEDVKKVEISVGQIKNVEKVENADRLLRLEVLFGQEKRQIVSGIAEYFPDFSVLIDKKVLFVTNLQPRVIKGLESNGMILAAVDRENKKISLAEINNDIPSGTIVS